MRMLTKWIVIVMILSGFLFTGLMGCGKPGSDNAPTPATDAQQQTQPTSEKETIKIGAIFSISGPASFLGVPEQKSAEMLVETINAKGGINGKTIELIIKDSQSKTDQTLAAFKDLVNDGVIAIIGPSLSANTTTIMNEAEKMQVLLISCAASEDIVKPVKRWVFKTAQKDSHAAERIFDEITKRGIKKVGILTVMTGFGQGGKKQLEELAPKYEVEIVANETYPKDATDLIPQLTNVKNSGAEAVINWSIEPIQGKVIVNMKQLQMNIPLFQSHGFGNVEYAKMAGATENEIFFPASPVLAPDLLPDSTQKKLCISYRDQYVAKFNEPISTFGGHAYDALNILISGINKVGTDKAQLRDYIENLKNFDGTGGIFNFSAEDHNGLDKSCFQMFTVKNGEFVAYLD